jgi:hypothetical protein
VNLSAIHNWSLGVVMFACTHVGADEGETVSDSRPASLGDSLQGKSWATVATDQGGYRLRLLTDAEKSEADQTIDRYRKLRGQGTGDEELSAAYRAMPSDVRAHRYYRIRRLRSDAIELKGDALHAILPLASVRVVLLGPTGSLEAGGRVDRGSTAGHITSPPQDFIQAMRGGASRGSGGRSGRAGGPPAGIAAGLLGAVVQANNESDNESPESKQVVFFLKYAEADSIFDIINELYALFDIRIAVEPRLNAVVVQCEAKVIEKIERLIESLDRETVTGPQQAAETPTLRAYSIEDADVTVVAQVLQTLLAGQPNVRLSVDVTNNRIIVLGRTADHETIKATIKVLEGKE